MHTDVVVLGKLGSVYGVKGWLRLHSYTKPIENIFSYDNWLIKKNGQWQAIEKEDGKFHCKGIVIKLTGVDDREHARHFTNAEIGVIKQDLPELDNDEYYWNDLIGLEVINKDGSLLGKITEVFNPSNSNDVFIVQADKKRHLIPFVNGIVDKIDLTSGKAYVDWDEDF